MSMSSSAAFWACTCPRVASASSRLPSSLPSEAPSVAPALTSASRPAPGLKKASEPKGGPGDCTQETERFLTRTVCTIGDWQGLPCREAFRPCADPLLLTGLLRAAIYVVGINAQKPQLVSPKHTWFKRFMVTVGGPPRTGVKSRTVVAPLLCSMRRNMVGGNPTAVATSAYGREHWISTEHRIEPSIADRCPSGGVRCPLHLIHGIVRSQ